MNVRITTSCLALATLMLAPLPASALDGYGVEVPLDVQVYDQPGGVGTPRQQDLRGGSRVILSNETSEHWCQVLSWRDPVPGGSGWIWCGAGLDGQDYSLRRLSVDEVNAP